LECPIVEGRRRSLGLLLPSASFGLALPLSIILVSLDVSGDPFKSRELCYTAANSDDEVKVGVSTAVAVIVIKALIEGRKAVAP
jgi:hypothetical protein